MWLTSVTVWLFCREGVAKSPCRCGSVSEIYNPGFPELVVSSIMRKIVLALAEIHYRGAYRPLVSFQRAGWAVRRLSCP